jgi:Ca2+-binding EF-hand superfamily protein
MMPITGKSRNLLVVSLLYLSLAVSLACQDAPADGASATTAASLSKADSTPGELILASAGASHGDYGRPGKERLDKLFERFDQDGDGKIALKDLPERPRERLSKADTNNDGQVTREELTKAWEQRAAEMKKKVDTNGDGVVSDQERAAARAKFWQERFPKLDKNQDKSLTVDEVPARLWDHIKVADANNDGKITLTEIDQAVASGKLQPSHRGGHKPGA